MLKNVTLHGGFSFTNEGEFLEPAGTGVAGAALIRNQGSTTIRNSRLTNNVRTKTGTYNANGAGIQNEGFLWLYDNTEIVKCWNQGGNGGGIHNSLNATVNMNGGTISNCRALVDGEGEHERRRRLTTGRFVFYCDRCGKEIVSDRFDFDEPYPDTTDEGRQRAKELLWRTDHDASLERANHRARALLNLCRTCGRNVCDDCFVCSDDNGGDVGVCIDCFETIKAERRKRGRKLFGKLFGGKR